MSSFSEIRQMLADQHPIIIEVVDGEAVPLNDEQRAARLDDWAQAAFEAQQQIQVKRWPDVQRFVEEFTLEERGAIALSQSLQIAALAFTLQAWRGEVHADHPLVQAGRAALVSAGILTVQRAAEIFDAA